MSTTKLSKDPSQLPRHVAIIMDGNGRWAKSQGKPRIEGHRQGVENVREIVDCVASMGIPYLTLFAFSAENWQRPKAEVNALMELLELFLSRYKKEMLTRGICFQTIGDIAGLPQSVQAKIQKTITATQHLDRHYLTLALNYGARQEITHAVQQYTLAVQAKQEDLDNLSWDTLSRYLYTHTIPDPDLLIRTSGETRLSNFLLLQCAYSELYFSSLQWPDFKKAAFVEAITAYQQRERRFGKTGEQLPSAARRNSSLGIKATVDA